MEKKTPIDNDALEASKEKVRVTVEALTPFEKAFTYHYLYNLGERIDGMDRRLVTLAPRKMPA